MKVCDAVAYAHHRGVIHRDLKPENIMVAGFGQVYLMDWGLARLTKTRPASGSSAQMEAPGPVGTPGYMSPEQARGNPAEMDERSDVFGLGAVLYEIVSGKMPFGEFRDADAMIERTCAGAVVPIDEALAASGVGVSKRLRDIVARATAARPEDRYASVVELQRDVVSFLRGGLHLPRKLFQPGARDHPRGRHRRRRVHDRERPLPRLPRGGRWPGDAGGHGRGRRLRRDGACSSTSRARRPSRRSTG